MKLVFIDFDHTFIKKDSLHLFICHTRPLITVVFGWIVLSPFVAAYKLKLISAQQLKENVLYHFLKGKTRHELEKLATSFSEKLTPHINTTVQADIKKLQEKGAKIIVVSASLDSWLAPFCKTHGFELIATKASFNEEGYYQKAFKTPNCKGKEKVHRINETYNLSNVEEIYCYGNKDDKAMLGLASSTKNSVLI